MCMNVRELTMEELSINRSKIINQISILHNEEMMYADEIERRNREQSNIEYKKKYDKSYFKTTNNAEYIHVLDVDGNERTMKIISILIDDKSHEYHIVEKIDHVLLRPKNFSLLGKDAPKNIDDYEKINKEEFDEVYKKIYEKFRL